MGGREQRGGGGGVLASTGSSPGQRPAVWRVSQGKAGVASQWRVSWGDCGAEGLVWPVVLYGIGCTIMVCVGESRRVSAERHNGMCGIRLAAE